MKRPIHATLLAAACAATATAVAAADLTRGPYLQANSSSSVIVVWKMRPASSAVLDYGPTMGYGTSVESGPDTVHAVTLTGLEPATRYYYRVRTGATVLAGATEHYFETAPASGGLRAAFFGDSGKGSTTQMDMARRIVQQRVDLIVHLGDIVYSSGEEKHYDSRFFAPYAGILRHTPIFTTLGNHDIMSQGGAPYFANFYLPTDRSYDGTEKHYSFDWGDAHFVTVNTNALTASIAAWVGSDLAASTKRWKFVFFHHATYSCGYHGTNAGVMSLLVPVLEAQNVDVVFAGHEHDYQRTFPMRSGAALSQGDDRDYVNPGGPVYVITGGGAGVRVTSDSCWYTKVALSVPHVTRMQIAGDLLFLDAVDSTGTRLDAMSIRKTNDANAPWVQILAGNGGEHWTVGSTATFTWMSGGVGASVDVQLSRDGGTSYEILASGITDTGTFSWTVTGGAASNCRLRVVATSSTYGSTVVDESDAAFVLDPASLPAAPAAAAAASPTTGEGPVTVTFTGTVVASSAAIVSKTWDFGDGTSAEGLVTQHTYTSPGTFTARFTLADANGFTARDSVVVTLAAAAPPQVAIGADRLTGQAPLDVQFTAQVSDTSPIASQLWSFGDGGSASGASASHTYTTAGTYVARFTATDAIGLSGRDSLTVTVQAGAEDLNAPSLATRSPAPGATGVQPSAPLLVSLVDRGAGVDAASIELRVDDQLVSHTTSGSADSLVVSHASSFQPGTRITVDLRASDRAATPNTAQWSWSFDIAEAPAVQVAYNFQPSSFPLPAGYVMDRGAAYTAAAGFGWERNVATEARTTNLEPELNTYVYVTNTSPASWQMAVAEGDYLVSLVVGSPAYTGLHRVDVEDVRVVDDVATGDRQFYTVADHPVHVADGFLTVRIGGIPGSSKKTKLCTLSVRSVASGGTTTPAAPTATAGATPKSGEAPLAVTFTGTSTGSIASSTWSFGDGGTATGSGAAHTYASAGTYLARFEVTDTLGRSARDSVTIAVAAAAAPVLSLSASPDSGAAPLAVSFGAAIQDQSTIATKRWTFGDGQSSTSASATHTYDAAGDYWARFVAEDDRGNTASDSLLVRVTTAVVAAPDTSPPNLATRTPGAGAADVDAGTALVVSLADAGSGVDAAAVVLNIDGSVVQATLSGSADSLVVRYAPAGGFAPGATVGVTLTAADRASPANTASWSWEFTTAAEAAGYALQVNFQPAASPVPSGYVADTGRPYDAARGYGWDKNISSETRTTTSDGRLATYVYISNPGAAIWQVPVTNGTYAVSLAVGSPAFTGLHRVEVEGVVVVNNVATGSGQFVTVTDHAATVTDGFLSVRIGGIAGTSKKTKLCYLTIAAGSGGAARDSDPSGDPPPPETPANQPPSVTAAATPASGSAPLAVQFDATATDPEGGLVSCAWDFGDGGTAEGASAVHNYTAAGAYSAIVTATDSAGATARDTVGVAVESAPVATGSTVRVNFQPSGFELPSGYVADHGRAFDAAVGFGWERNIATEVRTYADPLLATYAYVQNTSPATWSLAVANGVYLVTLVVGSPAYTGLHRVQVEDVVAVDAVATSGGGFVTVTDLPVRVSDGALSVRIGGIAGSTKKTKLCWIAVAAASAKPQATAAVEPPETFTVLPNPFRGSAVLRFGTAAAAPLRIEIFDVRGRLVRRLLEAAVPAGSVQVVWDGRTSDGARAAKGVYYARASLPARRFTTRLVLLE